MILTEAHEGSVWVAMVLPDDIKKELNAKYAVGDANDDNVGLHITLAYLGNKSSFSEAQISLLNSATESIAKKNVPLEFMITGIGRFASSPNSDGKVPVVLLPSAKGLNAIRTDLARLIMKAGVELPGPFDFLPHICVGYVNDPNIKLPAVVSGEHKWVQNNISFFVNPSRTDHKFTKTDDSIKEEIVKLLGEASRFAP